MKLEELERRLRNDLTQEAMVWGSRVLLHREPPPLPPPPTRAQSPLNPGLRCCSADAPALATLLLAVARMPAQQCTTVCPRSGRLLVFMASSSDTVASHSAVSIRCKESCILHGNMSKAWLQDGNVWSFPHCHRISCAPAPPHAQALLSGG